MTEGIIQKAFEEYWNTDMTLSKLEKKIIIEIRDGLREYDIYIQRILIGDNKE